MTSKYVVSQWNFSKLTEEQKTTVRQLFNEKRFDEIQKIYIETGVAPSNMGKCAFCDDQIEIKNWTIWAQSENLL